MSARDKVATLSDAAAFINDGDLLALGGEEKGQPMALAAELVRQGRRALRLAGYHGGLAADLLIRAGCGQAEYLPTIIMPGRGESQRPTREAGQPVSEVVLARFHAAAMGLPFLPLGRNMLPRDVDTVTDPHTGASVPTVAALHPDIAIIHVEAADRQGNVLIVDGKRNVIPSDIVLARAAKKIVVTVEQIVSERTVATYPQHLALLADEVTAVVETPYGAHPTGFSNRYLTDDEAFAAYNNASEDSASTKLWLDEWIMEPAGHMAYLEKLGTKRLMDIALSRRTAFR